MRTTKSDKKKAKRIEKFKNICNMEQEDLKPKLKNILSSMGYKDIKNEDGFLYAKGEVPVLLLAHMDTVHNFTPFIIEIKETERGTELSSPFGIGGDDRCGIYMILQIIKELKCSVLFLEDEEIGCIGAKLFSNTEYVKDLGVNYMIEFDRRGSKDAVFYNCDNAEFEDFVTEDFFVTNWGSCSDISHVAPAAGIAAVNLSCGYYSEHTKHEKVIFEEMETVIEHAKALIRKPVNEPFVYVESTYDDWGYYGYGGYSGYSYSGWSGAKKTSAKSYLEKYVFCFYDTGRVENAAMVTGFDKSDAILEFLQSYDHVPYKDIFLIVTEDQFEDFGIEV